MKNKFPGHFKLADSEIRDIWENGIFVLDANILLNLYRYSDETRSQFIKILKRLKSRIWVPHQAAEEYLRNRLGEIERQEKAYEKTITEIQKIEETLKSKRKHPFLSEKTLKSLCKSFEEVTSELEKSKEGHASLAGDDKILTTIERLVDKNVGDPFDEKAMEAIKQEGEDRYAAHIPPGYKDSSKESDSDPYRKFGDLIIWKQLIEKSKSEGKDVILVLDDNKEDWWVKFKGKTIGARPELTQEFIDETNQKIQMYLADRFLSYAGEFLKEQVSEPAIEELKKLRELEEMRYRNQREKIRRKRAIGRIESLKEKVPDLEAELDMIKQHKRFLTEEINHLHENEPSRANAEFGRIHHQLANLESKEEKILDTLGKIYSEMNYFEDRHKHHEPTRR